MKTLHRVWLIMVLIAPLCAAEAHDLRGIMAEQSALDPEVREKIDRMNQLRQEILAEARSNAANQGARLEAVVQRALRWPSSTISVCFFDGRQQARDRVARIAGNWSVGTGIRFDFGPTGNRRTCDIAKPSNIRVSFLGEGYSSYVGAVARQIPSNRQTLNLAGMDRVGGFSAYEDGVVLHEFGHAIGFEHEHQSPISGCQEEFDWDILPLLLQWPIDQIKRNMQRLNVSSNMLYTAFDNKSIMLYSLDRRAFKNPDQAKCYIPAPNNNISSIDRKAAADVYPSFASSGTQAPSAAPMTEPVGSPMAQSKLRELADLIASRQRPR